MSKWLELKQAIIARLIDWVTPSRSRPTPILLPGTCECDHIRSCHVRGEGKCMGEWPPDDKDDEWTECACQIYIRDDDDGEDEPEPTPTPNQLEELYRQ